MTSFDREVGAYAVSDFGLEDQRHKPRWALRAFLVFAFVGLVVRPILHLWGML